MKSISTGEKIWPQVCLRSNVKIVWSWDNGLIALNKPVGVLSHPNTVSAPSSSSKQKAPLSLISGKYNYDREVYYTPYINPVTKAQDNIRTWLLHRLDKDTSGLMLVSTNEQVAKYVKSLFQKRIVHKEYYAILCGSSNSIFSKASMNKHRANKMSTGNSAPLSEDIWIDTYSKYHSNDFVRAKQVTLKDIHNKSSEGMITARTKVIFAGEDLSRQLTLVKFLPETGYVHQLRYQAAIRGYPILGDAVYGNFQWNKTFHCKRLYLHSYAITLPRDLVGDIPSSTTLSLVEQQLQQQQYDPQQSSNILMTDKEVTICTEFPVDFDFAKFGSSTNTDTLVR